ncbi:patatin-like phospholipase family protein, partial [bacterium]|nr:patatin-like phospholipase family protein [bacterium]
MKKFCIAEGILFALIFSLPLLSFGEVIKVTEPVRIHNSVCQLERSESPRAKVILALSGGGAYGLAHAGVLKALEENQIEIDGIVGVSSGAIIGAIYSGGVSPDEIYNNLSYIQFDRLVRDQPDRRKMLLARKQELSRHLIEMRFTRDFSPIFPGAVSPGQRLNRTLLELILDLPFRNQGDWTKLPVPIEILATNLNTGEPVIFKSGDMIPAVRGSIAFPLLFDPLVIDSLHLVDGGITSNIPVDFAKNMGADIILAVDVSAKLANLNPPYQAWQIVDQITSIYEQKEKQRSLENADIVLTPDFDSSAENEIDNPRIFQAGYDAVYDNLSDIKAVISINSGRNDSTLFVKEITLNTIFKGSSTHKFLDPQLKIRPGILGLNSIMEYERDLYKTGIIKKITTYYNSLDSTLLFDLHLNPELNEIKISGNKFIPNSLIADVLRDLHGARLNFNDLDQEFKSLHSILRKQGFALAGIKEMYIDSLNNNLQIIFEDGILTKVQFKGLKEVPQLSLEKEIPAEIGQPLMKSEILRGVDNLYATGHFRSVFPEIIKDDSSGYGWKLVFHLHEHPSPPVRLGLAYQSQRRTGGFGEFTLPSPWHYTERLVLFSSVGEMDNSHSIALHNDRLLTLPFQSTLTLGYKDWKRDPFDSKHEKMSNERYFERRWGAQWEIGAQVFKWGLLSATARKEKHSNDYVNSSHNYDLSALGMKVAIDYFDRFPYPQKGMKFDSNFEFSANYLGSEEDFNRFWGSLESWLELRPRYNLGFRLNGRTADKTTPFDEKFRMGGIHEFPGLNLDEKIGIIQTFGGIELRFDLLSRLLSDAYLGCRLDVGGSWDDPTAHIKRENIMTSFAFYLALDTIIGPFHLQWGHLFSNEEVHPQ